MKKLLVMMSALLLAAPALAASNPMRPGLWEHSFTMKSQSGEMEKAMADMQRQMASMPPEQRKMMEQMMAAQGVGLGPRGNSVKVCLTAEDIARDFIPQQEADCRQEVVKRTAASMKVRFTCAGKHPTSGEGEIRFLGPMAYTGVTTVNTTAGGKPERMRMTQSGKWLSADCGKIRPLRLPPKS